MSLRSGPRWPQRLWAQLRRALAGIVGAWRGSLRVRVMTTTVAVGLIAVAGLGAVLSAQVRDGLFEDRLDQVLSDAAARAHDGQMRFDSAAVSNPQEVQRVANDVIQSLYEGTGAGTVGVLLLRSPDSDPSTDLLLPATDSSLVGLIREPLREQVREESFQQWQSVAIPGTTADGPTSVPGIAVGSTITLPVVDEHELYFIYSLEAEVQNLEVLQQVLVIGAAVLIALLVAMAWYLARQVLDPVRVAARTASRLADGQLTERMPVRGRDELAVLSSTFNEMAESLQDQIERLAELSLMQQRFVTDVSHELRTPLTTIRMAAEMLYRARSEFTPVQARSAELLANQLDRFESLLADLLEISRFDAGSAVLEVEETDVRTVVERVVDLTEPLALDRGSSMRIEVSEADCTADLDPRRVERILRNLLVNAIEHGEGGPIDVHIGSNANAVSVVVRDHGIGMTAPEAERVFDRFWRADPARTRTLGGTGLGLAISVEDAHLHGGTLEAWGSPGEGARFRLTLPRRAGLTVTEHPLPLISQRPEVQAGPRHEPDDPTGPAAVPDLTMVDAESGR